MKLTTEFKEKVRTAILEDRANYGGYDTDYAKTLGINKSIFNRIKKGEINKVLNDDVWITIGRKLNVKVHEPKWNVARTSVYTEIEDNLKFCKELSKSMILVDDCGIGKTFCTKHIIKRMKNTFYIDCSQAKSRQLFIRNLAQTIGINNKGKYVDVKADLKYYINTLEKPLIVLDEAGDLDYLTFLELKEIWNGTDGTCGWYMMGADGLRSQIQKGINNKKVGYAEIFSRFSDEFIRLVPLGIDDRRSFLMDLISIVAIANFEDKSQIPELTRKCLNNNKTLRFLGTLIQLKKGN